MEVAEVLPGPLGIEANTSVLSGRVLLAAERAGGAVKKRHGPEARAWRK